ncbi:Uncharacterised protein [Candidatus Bilamarchaeum dharawalense]|uniref:Uncharacterized protein n=1 Tax=Candidatus Bilamarchaeum dharawalense TaxID=2885759 RepID=A0A5E4LMW8_9ARCH|nr:Uncharacterised protein [Candidatus Bilamarchaeum dharawalense]
MNFSEFKKQAHKITKTGKPAKIVWTELKTWASTKGPMAMKAAVMEFVHSYHGSSEMSILLPELMRSTTFSPYEQKALIQLADHKVSILENNLSITPKTMLPGPSLSIQLDPKAKNSVLRSDFTSDPRQDIFVMKEKSQVLFARPKMLERESPKFDHTGIQSYSMAFDRKSHGEHLVRNLTSNIQSHGLDAEAQVLQIPRKIKAKRKIVRKISRKGKHSKKPKKKR